MFETEADRRTLRMSVAAALVLTVVSLILGFAGYRQMGLSSLDSFFGTLQLFALDAPRDLTSAPLAIGIARFTAPLALVMATVVAVTALVGQTLRHELRLRRVDGHVVVLGLSDNSAEFTNQLLEQGTSVVVVEVDADHPGLPAMRRSGALVVVGDAAREDTQRLAHIERSSRVVVSTGDDGRNLRAAETAARLLEGSRRATVHVLLGDYWLHEELARTEFMSSGTSGPEIDFVHRVDYEAAAFIEAVTVTSPASLESDVILFEGDGERGRRALIHLARRNLLLRVSATIVVDDETYRAVVVPEVATSPWLTEAISREESGTAAPGACIVAAASSDGAALARGLRLGLAHPQAEVFVLTDYPVGQGLLQSTAKIEVIPAGSIALSPASLFANSWVDTLARSRHQIYCALEVQRGADPATNPSITPWADLPESLKESNRDFARAISRVLEGIPLRLVPLRGLLRDTTLLSQEQMEVLARAEHDRWANDLVSKGWSWGPPPKNSTARTHPLLIDWEQLDEAEREKDRDSIRAIPTMLALVGLELQSD